MQTNTVHNRYTWETKTGQVAEWSIASVLKTDEVKASVGSNPILSECKQTKDQT